MSIITLLLILVGVGVALYLVSLIPMDRRIYQAIVAIVILLVVLWVLDALFGIGSITVGGGHHRLLR